MSTNVRSMLIDTDSCQQENQSIDDSLESILIIDICNHINTDIVWVFSHAIVWTDMQ